MRTIPGSTSRDPVCGHDPSRRIKSADEAAAGGQGCAAQCASARLIDQPRVSYSGASYKNCWNRIPQAERCSSSPVAHRWNRAIMHRIERPSDNLCGVLTARSPLALPSSRSGLAGGSAVAAAGQAGRPTSALLPKNCCRQQAQEAIRQCQSPDGRD